MSKPRQGSFFGVIRVIDVIRAQRREPPAQILKAFIQAIRGDCGDPGPTDNMAVVVIKCE